MFRCTLKVVVQVTLLTFAIFLFMYDDGIIASFNHFAHVTNKMDLCFCLQDFLVEKTQKSHSYLAHGSVKVLVQEVQQVLSWSSHRHFSHVTKSCIFKNLNLRKKADRDFRDTFLKNRFRHLKLYSNLPSWLTRSRCHMGTFWKTKDWSWGL